MHDSLISKGVITSPFVQADIGNTIEIASHNGINITKHNMPQRAEKCLAIDLFVWSVNIDKMEKCGP